MNRIISAPIIPRLMARTRGEQANCDTAHGVMNVESSGKTGAYTEQLTKPSLVYIAQKQAGSQCELNFFYMQLNLQAKMEFTSAL